MDEKAAREKAHGLSNFELHMSVNSKIQMSEEHIAAKLELEHRERNYRFWHQDLVAWLALVLAIFSLVVSFFN